MGSKNKSKFGANTRRHDECGSGLVRFAPQTARQADPSGAQFLISKARFKTVIERRHETLRRFQRLRKTKSAAAAARIVGSSLPTLWRWQKRLAAKGVSGLAPRNKPGRPATFARINLSTRALREIELLILELNSPNAAWRQFARSSALCPPAVATYVQRHGKAPTLLAGLGRIAPVQARVFVSSDRRRAFIKLAGKGTLSAQLKVPAKFNLVRVKP